MPTYPDAISDLITTVVENFVPLQGDFADIALNFTDYSVAARWFTRRKQTAGGHTLTFRVKHSNMGNYRGNVGLYDEDQPDRKDIFIEGSVTWTGLNVGIHFDSKEQAFRTPGKLVKENYIKEQINSAYQEFLEGVSLDIWSMPASSSDRGILGFPYWIPKSASTAVQAFGQNAGQVYSSDTIGGISQATYPRWKNGTGVYAANGFATEEGLDLLSEAMDKSNFRNMGRTLGSPDDRSVADKYEIFTTYSNNQALERYVRNQNDNVGADAGRYRGSQVYRGCRVMWLNELSEQYQADGSANPGYDADNPVYGINWDDVHCFNVMGTGIEVTGPRPAPNQRFVRRLDLDKFCQMVCTNRRNQFVLHEAD